MQITFVRHQGRKFFYLLGCKECKRCLKCQVGTGHWLPGKEDLWRGQRWRRQRSIASSSKLYWTPSAPHSQSLKLLWAQPLIPSHENKHPGVLSVSSQPLFFSWYILHCSCIPNGDQSSSYLHTSLFPHDKLFSGKEPSVKASRELPSLAVT